MDWLRLKIILLLFLISGCAGNKGDHDVLRIRLKEDPTTLDPVYIVDVVGGSIAAKLYSGLVRFDENCRIIPDVAESWDISSDGLVYTFRLRQITADTVKKTFEKVIAESPRKWIFDKVKEFKVVDNFTLRIILKEPFGPFLSLLTMPNAYVAPGPYKLAIWEHDKRIVLQPREPIPCAPPRRDVGAGRAQGLGEPAKVKAIEYLIIPEEFTAKTEFEMGNIDIMELSPIQWHEMAEAKPRPSQEMCKAKPCTFSQVGLNVYYIGFNCSKELFKNVRIRQAFNYAIDKEAIIRSVLYGKAVPAWGPIPPDLLKIKGTYPYKYMPNRARRILGILENKLRLYVRAQAQAIQIAEVIQHYLNEVNVRVEIVPLEWSAFKKAVTEGEPDLFLMSWWADYPDSENFLFPTFHSSNIGAGGNRTQFKNKKIDKLIEEAQKEMDPAKREKLYEELQRLINRQAPWIFLWNLKESFAVQARVTGFKLYPVYNSDKGTDVYISD